MAKYPPDPERFARAAGALTEIRASFHAVLSRADSPAPAALPVPATPEEYTQAFRVLNANLWTDGSRSRRHPDWISWRDRNPEHDAIFEAVFGWGRALTEALDWARHRTRPASGLAMMQERAVKRLAANDAELRLQGNKDAIKRLAADLDARLILVRADPFTAIVEYDPDLVDAAQVRDALERHQLIEQHAAVLDAISGCEVAPPTIDDIRDALTPPSWPTRN
ncbi:hypothetical protein [Nocardia nova]|uniref:hypothetical protein n=1 Tax=Nocardia nova TaxID=37330 RepID=UPI0033CCF346